MIEINSVYKQLFGDDGTLRKDYRVIKISGGRRSGKSKAIVKILALTAMQEPGHFIPCVRKVATSLKDSVLAEVLEFFYENNIPIKYNKQDKEIALTNGSRFRCFGLDKPEKMKSLKDPTIIWFEECDEMSEIDFDTMDAGLSPTKYPGRFILSHNPKPQIPGSLFWYERRFEQIPHEMSVATINEKANAIILKTWYKDNAFCPPETIKLLESYKETNPALYQLWALGISTKLEGVVFDNWDIVDKVPDGIIHDKSFVGLDWGFSSDPAAASRIWIHENDIYINQLVYKTNLLPDELFKELQDSGVTENDEIIADCSNPMTIADFHRRGFRGIRGNKKSANYKEDAANIVKSFKIHIIEGSTDLVREISTYSWARDKNNKQLPRLQDGEDHLLDGLLMVCAENTKAPKFEMWLV